MHSIREPDDLPLTLISKSTHTLALTAPLSVPRSSITQNTTKPSRNIVIYTGTRRQQNTFNPSSTPPSDDSKKKTSPYHYEKKMQHKTNSEHCLFAKGTRSQPLPAKAGQQPTNHPCHKRAHAHNASEAPITPAGELAPMTYLLILHPCYASKPRYWRSGKDTQQGVKGRLT